MARHGLLSHSLWAECAFDNKVVIAGGVILDDNGASLTNQLRHADRFGDGALFRFHAGA